MGIAAVHLLSYLIQSKSAAELQLRLLKAQSIQLSPLFFSFTVITSKDLQKHGNIWVCPVSDHVCTRFFFV